MKKIKPCNNGISNDFAEMTLVISETYQDLIELTQPKVFFIIIIQLVFSDNQQIGDNISCGVSIGYIM